MKVLLLDSYDSFTYNLFHYLEGLGTEVSVLRNDEIDWDIVSSCDRIVLSPGPGLPVDAGQLMELIQRYWYSKPMLGVCLGMQALAEHAGDELYNLTNVRHGVSRKLTQSNGSLFGGLGVGEEVGLYHSWAVRLKVGSPFEACAYDSDGVLMAIEHCELPLFGVQFHPESILTPHGKEMLQNFLKSN
ncbi:MAG: aminodeoxychorismate/anthranilate synthase component II [Bacteroidetes bacterium]|nr:MAG: aminodeoxychorismate/anthranilate synthase component II [Bacteroidota bacterium]